MGITEDYFTLYQEYQRKYGKIALLYACGKFFEVYEYPLPNARESFDFLADERPQEKIGNATEIAEILEMTLTCKDKSKPVTATNCRMMGFPCVSYKKHSENLLRHGYVVIQVVEKKDRQGKITREVEEILTPVTMANDSPLDLAKNCLIVLYLEFQGFGASQKYEDLIMACGLSMIDLATGKSVLTETYTASNNHLQEVYRFLLSYPCREILVYLEDLPPECAGYSKYLNDYLDLSRIDRTMIFLNESNKEHHKILYQREYLAKLFDRPKDTIIEFLNLERFTYGIIAYLHACQYCYETNPAIVTKLVPPDISWTDEERYCVLSNNAIKQLDLLPNPEKSARSTVGNKVINSLFSVVDHTTTPLGRRYLKKMLVNPITDVEELELLYNMTEELLASYNSNQKECLIVQIEKHLKRIHDVERLQRRLCTRLIKPHEFVQLYRSYSELISLTSLTYYSETKYIQGILLKCFTHEEAQQFNAGYAKVTKIFDLDLLGDCTLTKTQLLTDRLISPHDPTCKEMYERLEEIQTQLKEICTHLNGFLQKSRGALLEFDSSNDEGYSKMVLSTTNAKAKLIKDNLSRVDTTLCGELTFSTLKNTTLIGSERITQLCQEYELLKYEYSTYLFKLYHQVLDLVSKEYNVFANVNQFISLLDYVKSNAKTALKYHYERPIIDSQTIIDVEELRHPVIERIIQAQYVANDLKFTPGQSGLLLYGLNSSGKSCFVKSVSLMLIMAQAGMFVAGKLRYRPFRRIITRLSGEDEPFKGRSSFIVEMTELKTILTDSDEYTLVVGDELCRGTEDISAISLTVGVLQTLTERGTSFLFSSHHHTLPSLPQVKALTGLQIKHLSASYDSETHRLVYQRKLQSGAGDSIYGLEVAKAMGLDPNFITLAGQIRKTLIKDPGFVSEKKSRYNARLYMDECSMCKSKLNLHTHHIREQNEADSQGYIEYYNKNSIFNLMVLCQDCHSKIHSDPPPYKK